MEELKNEEVLTEEIQEEETTEIFEPDVDDIIPAEEVESKGSNGALLFAAGALVAGAVIGAVTLGRKIKRKWKERKGSGRYEWKEDDDEVFEEDDEVERTEIERAEVERTEVK